MAIANVQHNFAEPASTASATCVFSSAQTAHNLAVIFVGWFDNTHTITSVTDTKGNAYTLAENLTNGLFQCTTSAYYCSDIIAAAAGANTVTVAFSGSTPGITLCVSEWSGAATSGALDTSISGKDVGVSTAISSGNATTTNANDLLFGFTYISTSVSSAGASYTILDSTGNGNATESRTVTSTGSYAATFTASSAGHWNSVLLAFKQAGGATPVNAQVNLQGKANTSSFTARLTRLGINQFTGTAVLSLAPRLIRNFTLAIAGRATFSPSPFAPPTSVNATVHIFGLATGVPIAPIGAQARLRVNSTIPSTVVTANGRATLTLAPRVTHSVTLSIAGKGILSLVGGLVGPQPFNGTAVINGRASAVFKPFLIHHAQVSIVAGNQTIFPLNSFVPITGRATFNPRPKVTHNVTLLIQGRASVFAQSFIPGQTNFNGVVQIAGRANLRAAIPITLVPVTVVLGGKATLSAGSISIGSVSGTAQIVGTANLQPLGFTQGSVFLTAVERILGRATLVVRNSLLAQVSVNIMGRATAPFAGSLIDRVTLNIQGFASLAPQVPKQHLDWVSSHTIQYKVWQYNLESMVRVLGTTFTVTSAGMSFQSVALEVIPTDAGWGN